MWWWGVGEGKYSPMIRYQPFSETVPLYCELSMCYSVLPPPHLVGQNDWSGLELGIFLLPYGKLHSAEVVCFPSPAQLGSNKLQQVRLSLNSFSWRQTLLRRPECSGVLQNGAFFHLPCQKHGRFFSNIYCENYRKFLEWKLTKLGPHTDGIPLKFSSLRLGYSEPLALCQFYCSLSNLHWFPRRLQLLDFFFSKLWFSVFFCWFPQFWW